MSNEQRELTPREWNRRKFIAFGVFGMFGAVVVGVRQWIASADKKDGASAPLRAVLEFNDRLNQTYKSDAHLVKEYPLSAAAPKVRVNGYDGLKSPIDTAAWTLAVLPSGAGRSDTLHLTMDEIRALPKTEIVYDFKCIEGWSQVSHWGGVRFRDFAAKYLLGSRSGHAPSNDRPEDLYRYMGLRTPDGGYYVGIDMASALHPQTILAYEMNGAPLPANQGAPLRLIIPTKYGVKNLKRIGTMFFSDERPPDFWAERGYDYDAGL